MGCGWDGLHTHKLYEKTLHLEFSELDEIEAADEHFLRGDL
jgi:hypothetical protein